MKKNVLLAVSVLVLSYCVVTQANPVLEQQDKLNQILPNSFGIALYKPTYLLPYYLTGSPYRAIYQNETPNNEQIQNAEVKYQISLQVPVVKNIYNANHSLNVAYTQLSYLQAYVHNQFFRETDYEPEIFLANAMNTTIYKQWQLNFLNVGFSHQSNGEGDSLERTWNRIYLSAITSGDNWMLMVKPWIILKNHSYEKYNPNMANYLGYGEIQFSYKYGRQVFSIMAHNLIEGGGKRATAQATWSFPIYKFFNGYVQVFSGYGQSLIEYNHRTNSAGIGLALNDWI